MRNHIYLFFISIVMGMNLQAQSMEFLDINNARAAFWADGSMFWDKVSDNLYEWPKDSGTHISHATGLWLGGLNSADSLHGAYMRYGSTGYDYFPGPLDTVGTASIDSATMALYNRVWKINKAEVDQFRLCYCDNPSDPSCIGYSIPNSIMDWPGNPILQSGGQHLYMSQHLAPFYDANGDGLYNPMDCDYPLVKCDQSLFFVFNDRGGLHLESELPSMGVEVRAMAYACSCDSLDDAIFLDLQVINRSTETYYQTYAGLFSDADIGGSLDDYMGTNVDEGYVYHYNADMFDSDYSGQQGYGNIPPAHAILFLGGPWMDANGIADFWDPAWDPNSPPPAAMVAINQLASDPQDSITCNAAYGINGLGFNDNIVDNERLGLNRTKTPSNFADPIAGYAYYRFQKAFWGDFSAQIYGGNGYASGAFAGASRSLFYASDDDDGFNIGTKGVLQSFTWTENSNGSGFPNPSGDRKSISSAGPFTILPGETNTLTYGFVTARSADTSDALSLATLHQAVLDVKQSYYMGLTGCGVLTAMEDEIGESRLAIYPNPATEILWLESADLADATIRLCDLTGRTVSVKYQSVSESLTSLPVGNLTPGVYVITISKTGWSKSLKFIKN